MLYLRSIQSFWWVISFCGTKNDWNIPHFVKSQKNKIEEIFVACAHQLTRPPWYGWKPNDCFCLKVQSWHSTLKITILYYFVMYWNTKLQHSGFTRSYKIFIYSIVRLGLRRMLTGSVVMVRWTKFHWISRLQNCNVLWKL